MEAAVAAVKGARAEREGGGGGGGGSKGGVWIVDSWVEVQPVPGLTHFQQPAVRMEETRQEAAEEMEEISPKYLRKGEEKGMSAISLACNFRAPYPPTKLSVIITDGGR